MSPAAVDSPRSDMFAEKNGTLQPHATAKGTNHRFG